MMGDNRKAFRATVQRFLKTKNLIFTGHLDQVTHKVLDPDAKEEQIHVTIKVTNPSSVDTVGLIREFGGVIPDTNCQLVFTLTGAQSRAKKGEEDDTGTGELGLDEDEG